jgi:2-polyprenyl-3-methyl-5-hydroxy-6-metoxy-1,4-benzoquinol methylase
MSHGWRRFWEARPASRELVARELTSDRWKLIDQVTRARYGTLEKRSVIEVGAGMGTNALCMAIQRARVSILDIDSVALQRAGELFALFQVTPQLIQRNLFDPLEPGLADGFDVVMSFGLAEHFVGSDRLLCIQRHFEIARPGGLVIISVPNGSSFLTRFDAALIALARRWHWGWQLFSKQKERNWVIEVPFTRKELQSLGARMSSEYEVYATNFGEGLDGLLRWFQYPLDAMKLNRLAVRLRRSWAPMPGFDRRYGVSLVLIARRPIAKA